MFTANPTFHSTIISNFEPIRFTFHDVDPCMSFDNMKNRIPTTWTRMQFNVRVYKSLRVEILYRQKKPAKDVAKGMNVKNKITKNE